MKVLREQNINFRQINAFLATAAAKLKKAERILAIDEQIAFQAAYEAMLRASLGFMLSYAKRPRSTVGHHKIIIEFVAEKLGTEFHSLFRHFDLMRRKRNEMVYEPISTITKTEADGAITSARKFLRIIAEDVAKRNPQGQLRKK